MLPRIHRLPGYRIPELLKNGSRTKDLIVSIFVVPTAKTDPTRLTIIVPVRLSKRATARNRTRRLITEAIHQELSHIVPGFDGAVIAQRLLKDEKLTDIASLVLDALYKARLIVK